LSRPDADNRASAASPAPDVSVRRSREVTPSVTSERMSVSGSGGSDDSDTLGSSKRPNAFTETRYSRIWLCAERSKVGHRPLNCSWPRCTLKVLPRKYACAPSWVSMTPTNTGFTLVPATFRFPPSFARARLFSMRTSPDALRSTLSRSHSSGFASLEEGFSFALASSDSSAIGCT
jgi:hypothetical protein